MVTQVLRFVSAAKQFAQSGPFFGIVVIAVALVVLARGTTGLEQASVLDAPIELRLDHPSSQLIDIPLVVLPALEAWLQR